MEAEMIKQKQWVEMRNLYAQGMKKAAIARHLGVNRKTIANNLKRIESPVYKRQVIKASKLEPYKEYIKIRLEQYDLTASKLYEEIQKQGYTGRYVLVSNYVREIKGELLTKAVLRFESLPGEQAQVDWGYFGNFYDRGNNETIKLHCFFMILGYSRALYIEFFKKADITNFLKGHNNAFRYFGGYSRELLYDNLKSVVIKRALQRDASEFNKKFMDFAGYYGFKPILCRPYKPNTKGKVENSVLFAKQNFFRGEKFNSLKQINERALQWLEKINNRIHSTTKQRPFDRLKMEGLICIKDKKIYDTSIVRYRRVFNDCHFSYQANYYSVPFKYAGKEVAVQEKDEGNITVIYRDQKIAEHKLDRYAKGRYITTEEHLKGLKDLRMSHGIKKPKNRSKTIQPIPLPIMLKLDTQDFVDVQQRNPAQYEVA